MTQLDPATRPRPHAAARDRFLHRADRRGADERDRAAHLERDDDGHRPARPHRPSTSTPAKASTWQQIRKATAADARAARRAGPAAPSSRPAAARACTWWCRSRRKRRLGHGQGVLARRSWSTWRRSFPERFVAKSGAKNRVGRIFVDYLRNGFGATTACAWSARARPGLGVSVPVRLGRARRAHAAARTGRSATSPERIEEHADPWRAYARTRQTLTQARKKLLGA